MAVLNDAPRSVDC